MRIKSLAAAAFGLLSVAATTTPASAFFWDRPEPAGWGEVRTVRHWVYHPRYNHVYLRNADTDPYYYRYVPRGYYPYYNSAYWRPAYIERHHYHLPKYYGAWGSHKRGYHHVEWHQRHYGGHRRGNW